MNNLRTLLFIAMCILIPPHCMGPTDSRGGSGSEVVGVVEQPAGGVPKHVRATAFSPLPDAPVYLYPASFSPDTSWLTNMPQPTVRTASNGSFRISNLPNGRFTLEATDLQGNSLVRHISIDQESSLVDVDTLQLKQTAGLRFTMKVDIPGELLFYVGVRGTRLIARGSESNLSLDLDNIPTGAPLTVEVSVVKPVQKEFSFSNIAPDPGEHIALELESLW